MDADDTCPRCQQGNVAVMTIRATGERVRVCDECDAVWAIDASRDGEFEDLGAMLQERGLRPVWDELARVDG